jgi:hypothetical protein
MSTVSQPRSRVKPQRFVKIAVGASADNPLVIITIKVGSKSDDYCVKPLPADFGAAYEVEKLFNPEGAPAYTVHLSDDGAQSCECKGHLRWGHCKHGQALWALRQAGKL